MKALCRLLASRAQDDTCHATWASPGLPREQGKATAKFRRALCTERVYNCSFNSAETMGLCFADLGTRGRNRETETKVERPCTSGGTRAFETQSLHSTTPEGLCYRLVASPRHQERYHMEDDSGARLGAHLLQGCMVR